MIRNTLRVCKSTVSEGAKLLANRRTNILTQVRRKLFVRPTEPFFRQPFPFNSGGRDHLDFLGQGGEELPGVREPISSLPPAVQGAMCDGRVHSLSLMPDVNVKRVPGSVRQLERKTIVHLKRGAAHSCGTEGRQKLSGHNSIINRGGAEGFWWQVGPGETT
jgi:hypothetical protein